MSLLYVHSPLPPAKTGIADYTFETLVRLRNHFDIAIVDDGSCREAAGRLLLPTIALDTWHGLRRQSGRGADLYHLGNNGFHSGILQRALDHPGLAVVHDASLTGLLLSNPAFWPAFRRFTEYDLGVHADRFIIARSLSETFPWQDFLVRNLGLVADSSLGVIVHSQYVGELLRRRHQPRRLFHMHHHLAERFASRVGAAIADPRICAFLRQNAARIKIATFGFLTPPKRIDWLVESVARAVTAGADIALILGGEAHPDTEIDRLVRQLAPDRVLVTGFLRENDMHGLMCASDLHVALRFPSVGESSGTLSRAMGLGIPSVVLDHEAFSVLSPQHVTKVPLTRDVARHLADLFTDFCRDRRPYDARAESARAWMTAHASLDRSIEVMVEAVGAVAETRDRPSNLYRDLGSDMLACAVASAPQTRLRGPVAKPEELAERVSDALLADERLAAAVRNCRAEYMAVVVEAARDRRSGLRATTPRRGATQRRRKAVLVVAARNLQNGNIDFVVGELGLRRFDILLFVLLPMAVFGLAVNANEGSFDARSRSPDYLRERGRAVVNLSIPIAMLGTAGTTAANGKDSVQIPLQIVACEVLR
jgi:glycosyltransferase involved in cell wall biosynthesis